MRIPSRWQFRIQIDRCTHPSIDASQPWFPQWVGRLISGGLNFHPRNLFISVPSAISRPIILGTPPIILPKCFGSLKRGHTHPQFPSSQWFSDSTLSSAPCASEKFHSTCSSFKTCSRCSSSSPKTKSCQHAKGNGTKLSSFFFQVSSVKKKTKCNNADIGFTQNTCFWETYPMLTTIPVTIPVDETWSSSFGEAIPYPNRKNHVPSGDLTFCNWKYPIYSWFTYSEWWFSIATLVYQRVTFNKWWFRLAYFCGKCVNVNKCTVTFFHSMILNA